MANDKRGQKWDVKNGVAVLITPATQVQTQQVPSKRLDRMIERLGRQKERATTELAKMQARLDALTTEEAELVALRVRVTAEPAGVAEEST